MAEALLNVLVGEAQGLEHGLGLHFRAVDPDGAAAQLGAVEHDVIGRARQPALSVSILSSSSSHGGGEGVVHGHVAALFLGPLEHGELGDPQELEVVGVQDAQLLGALAPKSAQGGKDHLVLDVADDEDQVAVLGTGPLQNGGVLLVGQELLVGRR